MLWWVGEAEGKRLIIFRGLTKHMNNNNTKKPPKRLKTRIIRVENIWEDTNLSPVSVLLFWCEQIRRVCVCVYILVCVCVWESIRVWSAICKRSPHMGFLYLGFFFFLKSCGNFLNIGAVRSRFLRLLRSKLFSLKSLVEVI